MAAFVGIISMCGLRTETCYGSQPNKTKLALYIKLLFYFRSHLKQLYISKKNKHFSNKGGHGVLRHLKEEPVWAINKQFQFNQV